MKYEILIIITTSSEKKKRKEGERGKQAIKNA